MKHRLLLLIALLCTFAGSAQADTHFNDPNMTWISHNPSVKEPGEHLTFKVFVNGEIIEADRGITYTFLNSQLKRKGIYIVNGKKMFADGF